MTPFQVVIGFLTIVIYMRAFGPLECWGSLLSLHMHLFQAKARGFGCHPGFFFFCCLSAVTAKRSCGDFFVTVNSNDLEVRNRAAKTLKCRHLGFSWDSTRGWWRVLDSITMAIGVCEGATTVAGGSDGGVWHFWHTAQTLLSVVSYVSPFTFSTA